MSRSMPPAGGQRRAVMGVLERLGVWHPGPQGRATARLARWIVLGVLVGVVAGLAAIIFYWLLQTAIQLFLGDLAGYLPPAPLGEGNRPPGTLVHPWVLPLVVMLGGILSGLIVFLLAPEAEGHGTDAAIAAFHHKAGRVRARVIPIKTLASAITIGSGGSGGREGPTAQISAGVASLVGQCLRLEPNDLRILVATGIGAGIGAIFRAPLGGAVLAAEILYTHDIEIEALIPGLIASIMGYSIFGAWAGWSPIFGAQPELGFTNPLQLFYYSLLGLLCGIVGIVYAKTFYGTTRLFRRLRLPAWVKPAVGGLAVGAMALAVPEVLATGYGWLQIGMSGRVFSIPLWIVLLLPFAKILATSLSIGSGGSGGIFGPGMVIGGFVGVAFWRVAHGALPGMPADPAPMVIVAMMALFGGIAHAPLAVMLMVAEMTGNLSLLAPAMLAVGIATLVTGDNTIYTSQLPTRADSPAHRYQFSFPLLSTLAVRDALVPPPLVLRPAMTIDRAEELLGDHVLDGAPVVDEHRRLLGVLSVERIRAVPPQERATLHVDAIMERDPRTTDPDTGLDLVLEVLASHRLDWMPVTEPREPRLVGIVSVAQIINAYRAALKRTVRRMQGLNTGTVLLEFKVEPTSPLADHCLREVTLPPETLVVSIQRDGTTVMPHGDTRVLPGDLLMLLTSRQREDEVRAYLESDRPPAAVE